MIVIVTIKFWKYFKNICPSMRPPSGEDGQQLLFTVPIAQTVHFGKAFPPRRSQPEGLATTRDFNSRVAEKLGQRVQIGGILRKRGVDCHAQSLPLGGLGIGTLPLVIALAAPAGFLHNGVTVFNADGVIEPPHRPPGTEEVSDRRTDWFIKKFYTPKGFFTPPYETAESLRQRLTRQYRQATVETVEAMACFACRK